MSVALAEGYTESDRRPSVMVVRIPTAAPAASLCSRNTCKPPHSYAVGKRAVKMRTVDTLPSAVDTSRQDRPQESPPKRYITGSAGDAVGTLRRLLKT